MIMKFVADVEMSLTQEELENFAELSKQLNLDFGQTIRLCANEKCIDYLTQFKQEPPVDEGTLDTTGA